MTDEKPPAVVAALAAAEALGKRKKARVAGVQKDRKKARRVVRDAKAVAKHKHVAWLKVARVIDMDAYHRWRAQGVGAKKLAKALGTVARTAQKLMAGVHWQQDPVKVAEFNRFHSASIDPASGVPTANDLAKHGGQHTAPLPADSAGEKDMRKIVEDTGIPPGMVDTAMRRLRLLAGAGDSGDLPKKVDTKWLQDQIDATLGVIMTLMDPVALAGATMADLTRAASMLFEKRALLRGEPTAIVRNEQRGGLDQLAGVLALELKRRGVALPGPMLDITPKASRETVEGV